MMHPKTWISDRARIAGSFVKGGKMTTRRQDNRELKAKVALAAVRSEWTINIGRDAECDAG
jgi:hypothetical protein